MPCADWRRLPTPAESARTASHAISIRSILAASGWFILAAMVFDTLDGFAARLFKSTGRFGAELDSLCDAISFGVAPAFLLLQLGPALGPAATGTNCSAGVATLYLMCTILRLARYNVESIDGVGQRQAISRAAVAGRGRLPRIAGGLLRRVAAQLAVTRSPGIHQRPRDRGRIRLVARRPLDGVARFVSAPDEVAVAGAVGYRASAVPAAALLIFLRELAVVVLFWSYAGVGFSRHLWARADARRRALADERLRR